MAVVRSIFRNFVKKRCMPKDIAEILNSEQIPSPGHKQWTSDSVASILNNELYIGTMVYNKTTQKLQSKIKHNPKDKWIRTEDAFEAIVETELLVKPIKWRGGGVYM
ncbi:MAG TPA: recombinase family protein [Sedimentisphaerales bacterium]|nr:recombinase family protein [Sedimentisphaerales bacterium]